MIWWRPNISYPLPADVALAWLLRLCALSVAAVVCLILGFLVAESWPALRDGGAARFLGAPSWHPAEGLYDLTPMLWGTLAAAGGALLLAAPLGIASALFSRYYAPPLIGGAYRRLIEVLAGIPSVVYGLWGLTTLVPLIARLQQPGTSLLAGIVVLAVMILPTVALTSDAALSAVSADYFQGAAALGLSRWRTVSGIALPAARPGIAAGLVLAAGRALGETMAVLMVCGNVVQTPRNLFDPVRTLTANIALELAYAMGEHRAALFVSGLALMVLVLLLAAAAEVIGGKRDHGS